jgi:hypothetical protein
MTALKVYKDFHVLGNTQNYEIIGGTGFLACAIITFGA